MGDFSRSTIPFAYRNLIRMMMEDGFFKYLPKGDDNWVEFLKPFLKLTRKEKTKFNKKK